jgi:hypothetical protein
MSGRGGEHGIGYREIWAEEAWRQTTGVNVRARMWRMECVIVPGR